MHSMDEVEKRKSEIIRRVKAIQNELKSSELNAAQTFNLAEELTMLLSENIMISNSIEYFRSTAEMLMHARCSGPH